MQSVIVLPDNDDAGRAHGDAVARSCHAAGLRVKTVTLPSLPAKGDVSDWLQAGHTREELIALVNASELYDPEAVLRHKADSNVESPPTTTTATAPLATKESQATTIVRLVKEAGVELWHTPTGDSYITIQADAHCEHHRLESRGARDYLTRAYYLRSGKAPNASALQDAIATLSGIARFEGVEHDVHVRVAGDDDRIYIDLCNAQWQVVEIAATGWRVVSDPPVRFRRPRGALPLPVPERGGSIDGMRRFLNIASDDEFVLTMMWVLAALRPRGPYPILILMAEQGAAKTTTSRVLRRLCDPNASDVRRPPRNTEDLMIAATNGHVVAFDNLSRLPEELSDNLSVLATGGGFAVRQLYTNTEEQIFNAQRPIILNGISQVATRDDLLDRAIVITLPPIADERRRDEATFWAEFEAARPHILGALLEAVAAGLARIGTVQLERKPRMADFALWSVATESACPWNDRTFLRAYAGNRQGAIEQTLDGDPIVDVVKNLTPWEGTASDLLGELNRRVQENITKRKDWFSKPRQVADALRRLAPGLRRTGIEVTFKRRAHTRDRIITLEDVADSPSPSSPWSDQLIARGSDGDDRGTHGDVVTLMRPQKASIRDRGDDMDARQPLFSDDRLEALLRWSRRRSRTCSRRPRCHSCWTWTGSAAASR